MTTATEELKTLSKNELKTFILKIDFLDLTHDQILKIISSISDKFLRLEKQIIQEINIQANSAEINKTDSFDYLLIAKDGITNLRFSHIRKTIWIEAKAYKDNSAYKECIRIVDEAFNAHQIKIMSNRIGLRYINSFSCSDKKTIPKIISKRMADIVKLTLVEGNVSRSIIVEELNFEDGKIRLQYGVPNKFYPANVTTYDLLLDIDSYDTIPLASSDWAEKIKLLNHRAYSIFEKSITPDKIKSMK